MSAAIALIYDAAVDPSKWALALERACAFVGGVKANLFWQDDAAGQVINLHLFNDDPHFTRLYMEVYAALNPCIPAVLSQDVGRVYAATDLVPVAEFVETRFFREWVAPQGLADSIGVVLEKDVRGAAFLSIETSAVAVDGEKRRASLLVPHFQRAVAVGRSFARHKANETALIETLDQVSDAVFLLGSDGRLVFANGSGRRMIDEKKFVRVNGHLLTTVPPEADRAMQDCLRAIAQDEPISRQGTTFSLSNASDARWVAHLLPLREGAHQSAGEANDAVAALFVRQSIAADLTPLEAMAKTYGLTASEIRVVAAMLQVSGRDAVAEALGVSRATVKTHLSHIYRKCGAKNHGDLIKLVAGIGGKA